MTVRNDGSGRIDRAHTREPVESEAATPRASSPSPRPSPPLAPVPRDVDRAIHEALLAAARHASAQAPATSSGDRPGANAQDGVLYVGMNSENRQRDKEAATLRQVRKDVEVVGHGEDDAKLGPDHVRIEGPDGKPRAVDLATVEGARAFARSLGLPRGQTDQIAEVLLAAAPGSRDELAGIATVFARGERGEPMPGRLVLSGHSTGQGVYDGKHDGHQLFFKDLFALAGAMPRAAAKVEDVMLSACSSGYETSRGLFASKVGLQQWSTHFPNLKTAWGYGGGADYHSPSGAGATGHIRIWEKSTRGDVDAIDAARVARGTWRWENIATWSHQEGYRPGRT